MKLIKQLSLLFLLIGIPAGAVLASTVPIQVRTVSFPPYGINEQDKSSGIYYDMANLIVANAGYDSQNKIIPYARIVQGMKHGGIDLTIIFHNDALQDDVEYVMPLTQQRVVVMSLVSQSLKNISDLSEKKITYIRGTKLPEIIRNNGTITKYKVVDYKHGIKMLKAGRADAMMGSLLPMEQAILDFEKNEKTTLLCDEPLVVETQTPWLQVSKKSNPDIDLEKLKNSFRELEESGAFERIHAQYAPSID